MIKKILKFVVPVSVRYQLRLMQKTVVYSFRRQKIRLPVMLDREVKVILGAAMTAQDGWYSTNEQWLDITNESNWKSIFKGKRLIKSAVSEHVFEHLSSEETKKALVNIYQHLVVGGVIRIAVPDGYNPNPEYIRHVGISGIGADAEDHKQLLTSDSLTEFLKEAGFEVRLVEGYRSDGVLVETSMDEGLGRIYRSRSNKALMATRSGWDFIDANTSLIVDGIKK